jgi:hypothetical protein
MITADTGTVAVGALGPACRHAEFRRDGARGATVDGDRHSPGADDPSAVGSQFWYPDGREPVGDHPQPQLADGPVLRTREHKFRHPVQAAPRGREPLLAHAVVLSFSGATVRR